jgi:4-hydroxybutyrate CoA-transferase
VLPSSSVVEGERVSRIVPTLPGGAAVTVPRTLVDYVVTEHGIAHLRGKSLRERAQELIAIAHPDFQSELRREGNLAYNIGLWGIPD